MSWTSPSNPSSRSTAAALAPAREAPMITIRCGAMPSSFRVAEELLGRGGQGFAAGAVVAVELAPRVDGDADGRLRSDGLDVVPAVPGAEDEVARARVKGAGLAFDVPVDLALEHDPPLVMEMVVGVVGMAGRVADDE